MKKLSFLLLTVVLVSCGGSKTNSDGEVITGRSEVESTVERAKKDAERQGKKVDDRTDSQTPDENVLDDIVVTDDGEETLVLEDVKTFVEMLPRKEIPLYHCKLRTHFTDGTESQDDNILISYKMVKAKVKFWKSGFLRKHADVKYRTLDLENTKFVRKKTISLETRQMVKPESFTTAINDDEGGALNLFLTLDEEKIVDSEEINDDREITYVNNIAGWWVGFPQFEKDKDSTEVVGCSRIEIPQSEASIDSETQEGGE